jgi:hypothetical protein
VSSIIKTEDYNLIMADTQWKDHTDYIISAEDLLDFDDLICVDHHHFALIHLKCLAKYIAKEKEVEIEYEREKVCATD